MACLHRFDKLRYVCVCLTRIIGSNTVFQPSSLASQNMVLNHFSQACPNIPAEIRSKMMALKESSASSIGAGRKYWSRMAESLGVYETEQGLLMR